MRQNSLNTKHTLYLLTNSTAIMKAKRLHNRVGRIYSELIRLNNEQNLQLEAQDIETKRDLWKAIDNLKSFLDNIN